MTNRKNYNSIVFLSTLCLGLILVGATPYISSQFALTKIDEIPIIEDLDQLPEDDSDFQNLFISLLKEIKKEAKNQRISLPLQSDFKYSYEVLNLDKEKSSSIESTVANQNLNILLQKILLQKVVPFASPFSDQYAKHSRYSATTVDLNANTSEVILQISFSADNSENISSFLKQKYSAKKDDVNNLLLSELYKNTDVSYSFNQVFIVTRLPRGSIDSLLKQ